MPEKAHPMNCVNDENNCMSIFGQLVLCCLWCVKCMIAAETQQCSPKSLLSSNSCEAELIRYFLFLHHTAIKLSTSLQHQPSTENIGDFDQSFYIFHRSLKNSLKSVSSARTGVLSSILVWT